MQLNYLFKPDSFKYCTENIIINSNDKGSVFYEGIYYE